MKLFKTVLLTAMLCMLAVSSCFAANSKGVDWDSQDITVTGYGAAPSNIAHMSRGRMMARRAAIVDAYRQLAEFIQGVNVDGETTVENFAVSSDIVRTKVNAVIRGAKVIDEKELNGGYEVTMTVPMFGVTNSLASAVLPEKTEKEPFIQASTTSYTEGNYTGVIIDCRGLGLNPVMSPVVMNASYVPIYGYKNLDYDYVVEYGMAGYSHGYESVERAGSHPLIIKAQALLNHNANPVISNADADKILAENERTHFLEKTRVVFIR